MPVANFQKYLENNVQGSCVPVDLLKIAESISCLKNNTKHANSRTEDSSKRISAQKKLHYERRNSGDAELPEHGVYRGRPGHCHQFRFSRGRLRSRGHFREPNCQARQKDTAYSNIDFDSKFSSQLLDESSYHADTEHKSFEETASHFQCNTTDTLSEDHEEESYFSLVLDTEGCLDRLYGGYYSG